MEIEALLGKFERLRDAAQRHNADARLMHLGYPRIAPYCATVRFAEGYPYVALFNAPTGEGEALARFLAIDRTARIANRENLSIEVAALALA